MTPNLALGVLLPLPPHLILSVLSILSIHSSIHPWRHEGKTKTINEKKKQKRDEKNEEPKRRRGEKALRILPFSPPSQEIGIIFGAIFISGSRYVHPFGVTHSLHPSLIRSLIHSFIHSWVVWID